ncbi:HNH endonuclease [Streptomyces sp. SM12]|uniref:HNH endonuclease n=1 Tax=Streptomyces sp. SM12 TaxID=1071602 RepID=UPI000CD4B8F4
MPRRRTPIAPHQPRRRRREAEPDRGTLAREAWVCADAYVCYLCGTPFPADPVDPDDVVEVDHAVPRALGGDDGAGNLAPAHRGCNRFKGDQPAVQAWRDAMHARGWDPDVLLAALA